jgi:cytidyltransferase-like protein
MNDKIIAVSGGMDPAHRGHVRMINDASKYGKVVVILNSDEWLKRKKGYVFMEWEDRKEVLMAFENVHDVVAVDDHEGTVCEAIMRIRPDYFGNGGDRTDQNTPERSLCEDLGVELVWGLGGNKIQSSSELVDAVACSILKKLSYW